MAGSRREGTLPHPEQIVLTPASENDLKVFERDLAPNLRNVTVFADKIYRDKALWRDLERERNVTILTPIKAVKGASEEVRQRCKAADDLYSAAVSRVREPIEAFFNWLNEKTNIQRAYRCRSTSGLIIHTLGKLAIAFIPLIFNY